MITPSKTMSATFPYKIEEKIGAGGMGIVYRAYEPALNRRVAIKVLRTQIFDEEPPAVAEEYRKRFMQEARAAAALSHPGATTIYRIGEEDGVPYIAMEWLEGKTLEQVLVAEGRLPHVRAARIGVELLETLDAAHRAGVVHRDVKPANLIILDDGRLKVTDFGIARVQDSDLVKTGTGTVLATPQFASPEQLQGDDVDGRSDLFSVGVVLYLSLTGRFPFEGRNYFELMASLARSEAAPLRQYAPEVPEELERAILCALRRMPRERFGSAAEMAAALRTLTGGVSAPLPSELTTQSFAAAAPAPDTIRDPVPAAYPIITDVPRSAQAAVVRVVETWAPRHLGTVKTATILARLLERPLHAPPYDGGVFMGGYCLMIHGGFILGAVDASGRSCDEVCEQLPDEAVVTLHPAPAGASCHLVPLLASLLHPPKVRVASIDTSLVNLPVFAARLAEEKFDGILRLERAGAVGYVLIDQGQTALSIFSDGWENLPIDSTWERWMSEVPISGTLEEKVWMPAHLSYRKELKDFWFDVAEQAASSAGSKLKQAFLKKTANLKAQGEKASRLQPVMRLSAPDDVAAMEAFYSGAPIYRFLDWAIDELPAYFEERGRAARWKYLVDWISLVRKAALHHELPRPDSRHTDFFDLATFDGAGKVLHLAHRVPRGTPEALAEFVNRVVEAKKARTKTGDVGGAFLLAPSFDESMLEAYQASTKPVGTGLLSVEEKLTKYEGFIRMGPRRGFHLLLVAEKKDGFEPLLLV